MWWLIFVAVIQIAVGMMIENHRGARGPQYYEGMSNGLGSFGVIWLVIGIVTLGASDAWAWLWRAAS